MRLTEDHSLVKTVSIEVVPFNIGASPEQWLLGIFEFMPTTVPLPLIADDSDDSAVAEQIYARDADRLRGELSATMDSLQCIIEEQEAANEEIKSANEEIESSNEELETAKEELQSTNEELQSTNEELSTVNEELNQRNQEISKINNDLNNLLSSISINIAIIMVDNHLTPVEHKVFDSHGSEYSLRVRPYRTRENVINGVVITLVDINQPSKSQSEGESH